MAVAHERDLESTRKSLNEWLGKQLPHATNVEISVLNMPATNGFSNQTFLFDASWVEDAGVQHKGLVARPDVLGPGKWLDYNVLKQASVMEALKQHSEVPVPTVLWKEEDPSVLGTRFFVMERVDGRVPADDPPYTAGGWVMDCDPAQRGTIYDNGLRVLAKVHAVDWETIGLGFLARTEPGSDVLEREIAFFEKFYAHAADGREHPTLEATFEWIRANRPTDVGPVVLNWGDGRIGNMIFGNDLSVAAALDWELASLGSPEQDLGHWLFQDRIFTEGKGLPLPDGFPKREDVISRYEEYSGRQVKHIEFYETLAALRSAICRVRSTYMMIDADILPPDSNRAQNNAATRLLADMIGLPAPAARPAVR